MRLIRLSLVRLLLAAAVLGALAEPAFATTVTASSISFEGKTVPSGTITFLSVDAGGKPSAFSVSGGGLQLPGDNTGRGPAPTGIACAITTGAISGTCTVPDALTSTPVVTYNVQICDTVSYNATTNPGGGSCYTLYQVNGITGSSWALDQYVPLPSLGAPAGIYVMSGVPTITANDTALYFDSSVTPYVQYIRNGGSWLLQGRNVGGVTIAAGSGAGSGATAVCTTGVTCTASQGRLTIVAGTSPSAGTIATVTITSSARYWPMKPKCDASANAVAAFIGVGAAGESTSTFNVLGGAAITGTNTVDYHCSEP